MTQIVAARPRQKQRRYVSVSAKFAVALTVALLWMLASILLSQQWLDALGELTHPIFAIFAISFIAFIPAS